MLIGELNKRITIQSKTMASDSMGGYTETYSDHATVWAAIWPVSAKEMVQANSTTMVVTHKIRIRYRGSLRSSWRIKFGNRYFAIVGMSNPNEKNEYLDLLCKESS